MRTCKDCNRRLLVTNRCGYCTPCGKRHRCWRCNAVHPAGRKRCIGAGAKRAARKREEASSIKGYKNYVAIDPLMTNDPVRLERIERYKERATAGKPLFA